jgi:hypothetical protein
VAALQQSEPTLQQVLAHTHRHDTRWMATAAGGAPLPEYAEHPAAMVPQAWQQGADTPPQQGRRKIGRPIAFTGDPDSMDLTDADRRRLKR